MSGMELLLQAAAYTRPNYVVTVESSPTLINTNDDTTNLKKREVYYSSPSRSTDSVSLPSLPPKKRRMINFRNDAANSASSVIAASNSSSASSSISAGTFLPQLLRTNDAVTTSQPASLRSTVSVSSSNSHASHNSQVSRNSHYSNNSSYTDSPIQTIAYPPRHQQPQAAAAVVGARSGFIHHLCNTVIVPNTNTIRPNPKKPVSNGRVKKTTSHGLKRNRMTSASKLSKKRNPRNPLVKDVDGNDMCMGYFSMPTAQRRSSPPVEETALTAPSTPQSEVAVVSPSTPTTNVNEKAMPPSEVAPETTPPETDSTKASKVATSLYTQPQKEMASAMSSKSLLYQAYLQALSIDE